jgi:hypothetical protein
MMVPARMLAPVPAQPVLPIHPSSGADSRDGDPFEVADSAGLKAIMWGWGAGGDQGFHASPIVVKTAQLKMTKLSKRVLDCSRVDLDVAVCVSPFRQFPGGSP